eukprot:NODE_506_length_6690_cov_0.762858.p8 type:complete len:102 gc:universal NODE_506_length_6690_cov_0.762858:1097-1402(+)
MRLDRPCFSKQHNFVRQTRPHGSIFPQIMTLRNGRQPQNQRHILRYWQLKAQALLTLLLQLMIQQYWELESLVLFINIGLVIGVIAISIASVLAIKLKKKN